MKRLVVTDQAFGNTSAEEAAAKAAGAKFSAYQLRDEAETAEAVEGAHAILNNFAPMTERVMARMASGAVIVRYGVGVDNVDLSAARQMHVRVCNVPDYGVDEVADHAAAMAVFLARRIHRFDAAIRTGEWRIAEMVPSLRSLSNSTVGLIGLGRIAQGVARRMRAFGCTVIAHDPFVDPDVAEAANVRLADLDTVISAANILSLHVPYTPETHHILSARRIAALPRGAIVVNCSRGGLVDESALADALKEDRLAAAGLDTFEAEPLPTGSPLRSAPNLFLSPHAAFYSDASVQRLQQLAADEALRALRGAPLRCQIV